jgi:hypothetical protein
MRSEDALGGSRQRQSVAHALEPAIPSPDKGRDALPIACNDERAVPNARARIDGRSEGE